MCDSCELYPLLLSHRNSVADLFACGNVVSQVESWLSLIALMIYYLLLLVTTLDPLRLSG